MRPLIYIQVHQGFFIAKHLGNGKIVRKECAGLDHPRTLMGDFHKVQECFAAALKELLPPIRLFKPKGLVHLVPVYDGGYTNVETRAFKEAGEMAGINFAFLSTMDRPHTDSEVLEVLR
jgi:hypothetical protein